jgi:hypothetical protein
VAELKPLGPDQLYDVAPEGFAARVMVCPAQRVGVPEAVGEVGIGWTVTLLTPAGLVQPLIVTVTEYDPEVLIVALLITGFCEPELKPLGPDHKKLPPEGLAVRLSVEPAQMGPLLPAAGAAGVVFTVTARVPGELVHPAEVTYRE